MADEHIRLIVEAQNRSAPAFNQASRHAAEMSRAMQQSGRASGSAMTAMSRDIQRALAVATTGLQTVGQAARRLQPIMNAAAAGASRVLGSFKSLGGAAVGLAQNIGSTLAGALNRVISLAKVAAVAVGVTLAGAFAGVTRSGFAFNQTTDAARAALTKMLGSASSAEQFLADLSKEAATSAPTLQTLIPIAQQLVAAYGPGGLGKVLPTIRAFGDAAASLGVDQAGMGNAMLGFRQLITRDKPTAEDLGQVRENLPGLDVGGILKKSFGTADTDALGKAGVTGMQMGEALIAGMAAAFGGAQVAGALKLPTLFSNIQDAFERLAAQVTMGFMRSMEGAGGSVTRLLEHFNKLADNPKFIAALSVPFDLAGKALDAFANMLPGLAAALEATFTKPNVIDFLATVTAWFDTVVQQIGRFVEAATGGNGLSGAWQTFGDVARKAIDLVIRGWNALVAGVEYLAQHSGEIWGLIADGMKVAGKAIDAVIGGVVVLGAVIVSSKILELLGALASLRGFKMPGLSAAGTAGFSTAGAGGGSGLSPGMTPGPSFENLKQNVMNEILRMFGVGRDFSHPKNVEPNELPGFAFDKLAGVGAAARGAAGSALGGVVQGFPERGKQFFGGLGNAMRGGASSGLDDLLTQVDRNKMVAQRALASILASGAVAASPMAPAHAMYGQGGGGGSSVTTLDAMGNAVPQQRSPFSYGGMDPKAAKALQDGQAAYLQAQLQIAEVQLQGLPEQERAFAEMQRIVPILQMRQQMLRAQLAGLSPQSDDYWKNVEAMYSDQEKIESLQRDAYAPPKVSGAGSGGMGGGGYGDWSAPSGPAGTRAGLLGGGYLDLPLPGVSPYATQEVAQAAEYARQNAAGYGGPVNRMTQGGGYQPGGGSVNANINVSGMSFEQFRKWWMEVGSEVYRQANPSPSSF